MHDVGAGVTPTVADHVARFLVDRGVEMVFGLCGHTNISSSPQSSASVRRVS